MWASPPPIALVPPTDTFASAKLAILRAGEAYNRALGGDLLTGMRRVTPHHHPGQDTLRNRFSILVCGPISNAQQADHGSFHSRSFSLQNEHVTRK
jgi:hypothetical protein